MAATWWSSGLRAPALFLVPGNCGKPDNLSLSEARHFTARISSEIPTEASSRRWPATPEPAALSWSQLLALPLGLLIPAALGHAQRVERGHVPLRGSLVLEMYLGRSEQPLAPVRAPCLSSGGGGGEVCPGVLCPCAG